MAQSSCPVVKVGGISSCGACVLRQRGQCAAAHFPSSCFGFYLASTTRFGVAQFVRLVVTTQGQQVLPKQRGRQCRL